MIWVLPEGIGQKKCDFTNYIGTIHKTYTHCQSVTAELQKATDTLNSGTQFAQRITTPCPMSGPKVVAERRAQLFLHLCVCAVGLSLQADLEAGSHALFYSRYSTFIHFSTLSIFPTWT